MKTMFTTILAMQAAVSAAKVLLSSKVYSTPISSVLAAMEDMKSKGIKGMATEKNQMELYTTFVKDTTTNLGFDIETASAKIEKLEATIAKKTATATERTNKFEALSGEVEQLSAEKSTSTKQREAEHAAYAANQKDLAESVQALQEAITTLKATSGDKAQAEMLLQNMASKVQGGARVLAAYLQLGKHDSVESGAPEVAAYEFQSGGIVSVLEGLLEKFTDELNEVEKAETNQAHANALEQLHLKAAIEDGEKDASANKAQANRAKSEAAQATQDLADTEASRAEDSQTRADMIATYESKKAVFEANQKLRKEEIDTIAKVIDIIASPDVQSSYGKHVKLVQTMPTTLLQTLSGKTRVALRNQVATLLRRKAALLSSKVLASLANQVEANPFDKVIGMIEGLIAKLKEEAVNEANHKQWCDDELKKNKKKREKKTSEKNSLTADVEALTATIDTLAREIATLLKEQKELGAAMEKATAERNEEKATNEATIADAAAGAAAVKKALSILHEFYGNQAALVQQDQVPEMAEYKGMHSSNGGVVGMLEVIETDFQRLEADTTAAENKAASDHDKFMKEATHDKKSKHKSEVKKSLAKDEAEFQRGRKNKDLAAVSDELAEANKYFESLKPNCLEVHVSYEERVARRKEEIQALKDAYKVLEQKLG